VSTTAEAETSAKASAAQITRARMLDNRYVYSNPPKKTILGECWLLQHEGTYLLRAA
jgi:hypothetical protein